MKLQRIFDDAARTRVRDAVRQAEAASRGEIVPMVVERCESYPEARLRAAGLFAALGTLVFALTPIHAMGWFLLPAVQVAAAGIGALLAFISPFEQLFIARARLTRTAVSRATQAFVEEGVTRTAEGTGVLLFVALFEHTAVVLGDEGINAKMGDDWAQVKDALVRGMRQGDPASGFIEAIGLCGARLAEHFPKTEGVSEPNELDDRLRERKR